MKVENKRRKTQPEIGLPSTELLTNNVDEVQTFLGHIDVLLRQADEQLGKLQPPDGRIRIEWWKCPQGWAANDRCPTLVRWRLTKNRAWQAERLPITHLTSRAKRNGWFRESHQQVTEVLDVVGRLLALRTRLTTLVSRHLMTVNALYRGNMEMLARSEGELATMGEWVALKAETLSWAVRFPADNRARQTRVAASEAGGGGITVQGKPDGVSDQVAGE